MCNVNINKMTIEDFKTIEENFTTEFDEFWTSSILEEELKNENSYYIVAKVKEEIIGFAGIWFSVDDIHITNIAVRKDLRGNGIGSILLNELIKISKETDKQFLTLEVKDTNEPAKCLYKKHGFKIQGIRKKYYNNKEDAIIMTLIINGGN